MFILRTLCRHVLGAAALVACGLNGFHAPQSVSARSTTATASVQFAVIGDSGTGGADQYDVAAAMAASRGRLPFGFVIMLGDNVYGGWNPKAVAGKFERPYKPLLDAGVQFYASLGNHDAGEERSRGPMPSSTPGRSPWQRPCRHRPAHECSKRPPWSL